EAQGKGGRARVSQLRRPSVEFHRPVNDPRKCRRRNGGRRFPSHLEKGSEPRMNAYSRSLFAALALLIGSPAAASAAAQVTVYKTPWCGCCHAWAEAVEKAGYKVSTLDLED